MLITTDAGEQFAIDVEPEDTISDVKTKIRRAMGIPLDKQILVAYDSELDNDIPLSEYGLDDDSTIHLISLRTGPDSAQLITILNIKTEDGGRITLEIEPSRTISDIKQKIQDQQDILFDEQLLVIDEFEVEDDRPISYYRLDENSTIHLIRIAQANPSATSTVNSGVAPLSDFYVACRDNDLRRLQQLLSTLSVEEMNRLEPNGSTGLHVACFRGHLDVVKLLLNKGVNRSIVNRYNCLPYEEAASNTIRQLFYRIPGQDRSADDSGRLEWTRVASNAPALSARNIAAVQQRQPQQFESAVKQIIDNYIVPQFRAVNHYEILLRHFQMALRNRDPKYLAKAYTVESGFYTKLNRDLASDTDVGKAERQLYIGILAFDPYFDRFRFRGEAHRGMRLTEDDLKEYGEGQLVMTKSFLSASTKRNQAEIFVTKHQRQNIHGQAVKMGAMCTYVIQDERTALKIYALSEYPDEQEILILPHAVFAVTSISRSSSANSAIQVHLTLIQHSSPHT